MTFRDPLADVEPLVRRVYAYAAYRLGDGSDAEDVTSETFERALRYRDRYDPARGEPISWLIGIARRQVDELFSGRRESAELVDVAVADTPEDDVLDRLALHAAVAQLDARDRELVALRYGADLKARQIAELLGERTNTVEVALHRALRRLRAMLDEPAPIKPRQEREADAFG